MELNQDKPRSNASEREALHRPDASPFNAEQERQELQHLAASAPPVTCPDSCLQEVVATAVPIYGDAFQENNIPIASATAVTETQSTNIDTRSSQSGLHQSKDTKETQEEVTVSLLPTHATLPTAPTLQSYTIPTTYQHTTASLLRQAQHRGEVEKEIEKTKDMYAKARVEQMRNETATALEIAKVKAQKAKRVDEGLTVDEGIHHNYISTEINTKSESEPVRPFGTTKDGKRGYEVNPYDVAEYDTAEYDVTEYKSVYD